MDDEHFKQHLKLWTIAPPEAALAGRIIAQATALKQLPAPGLNWQHRLIATFCDWHSGWGYKLASLSLCAAIGFAASFSQSEAPVVEVLALAFGGLQAGQLL
ncbi:MAG: hypothetical protein WC782_15940 [Methylococcaceae bacterium]|jgi:hypothetical protein